MVLRHSEPREADSMASTGPVTVPVEENAVDDPLGDVFGSDDVAPGPSLADPPMHIPGTQHHPSDLHRLQQQHVTAGYRDGVTAAKAESIQSGFDEGFSLGAAVGI